MKKLLHFSLILVVLLALSPALSVFAQGGNPLCNGLSESDCKLINDSAAAMEGVTSFAAPAYSIELTLSAAGEEIAFSASGSAHFMLPTDMMNPFAGLLVHLVIDEASISVPDMSQSGSAEILVKGNMVYVKMNDVWYGGEITAEELGEFQGLLQGGMGAATGGLDIDLTNVVSTVRGADMGDVAVFTTSIDINALLTALLSSPALFEMLGAQMDYMGEMTPEQLQMMGMILGPMLTGTSVSFEQWIGTGDLLVKGIKLDVVLALDASLIDPEVGKIDGELHFASEVADINGTFDVPVPDSFKPLEELDLSLEF